MIETVLRKKIAFVKTKKEAIQDFENFKLFLYIGGTLSIVAGIFYPPVGFAIFGLIFYKYFVDIYEEFLTGVKRSYYDQILQPLMTPSHYLQIGYEIREDSEELNKHLAVMQMDDKRRRKELKRLSEYIRKYHRERIIGFSKDILTRHAWILGATGAGKTSLLMTAFHHLFRIGAGVIFVDGKSDAKMFQKFYSLAVDTGKDVDVFCVNTLKPEKTTFDTNTFSPLASLPPTAQIEFLASLASTGSNGDMAYWEGRGKALLAPIIFALAFRKQFFGEDYSYKTVSNALTAKEFGLLVVMLYIMCLEQEKNLREDKRIQKMLRDARKVVIPRLVDLQNFECLVSYCIQYPQKAAELEKYGYSKTFLENLFRTFSIAYITYLSALSTSWTTAIREISKHFYEFLQEKGEDPLEIGIMKWRTLHEEFLKKIEKETSDAKPSKINAMGLKDFLKEGGSKSLTELKEMKKILSAYLQPPEKDVTQHQYAQQQWTNLFASFDKYSHIFGSLDPDIDMIDVIRNNRMLYVLIPALEQDKSTAEILGKSIVMAIKAASSVALGGKLEGLTDTQQKIVNAIITPIPLGMVVLDEYGAYPVPGIDLITSQVRSLNISFWLSTQDYTSGRVGGTDENTVKRAWANTITKVLMKLVDIEVKQKAAEEAMKRLVASPSGAVKLDDKDASINREFSISAEEIYDPKITSRFKDGFCLIISDGIPAYVQVFWADQKPIDRLFLNRFDTLTV